VNTLIILELKKAYVRLTPYYDALDIVVNRERVMVMRRGAITEAVGTIVVIGEELKDVNG